jgi:hypothetical protein
MSLLDTGSQLCFHYYCNPPYVWFWKSRNQQKLNLYTFQRKSEQICLQQKSRQSPFWAGCEVSSGECLPVFWGDDWRFLAYFVEDFLVIDYYTWVNDTRWTGVALLHFYALRVVSLIS